VGHVGPMLDARCYVVRWDITSLWPSVSRGLGRRRAKPKAAMHRKKQVRRGGKRRKGFFINHHHKKLQSINWKTTVIPRNQHVLRDKIMGKNQGSCQQGRGLFRVRLKWLTFGVAAMAKVTHTTGSS
jgi:hypothetical protein